MDDNIIPFARPKVRAPVSHSAHEMTHVSVEVATFTRRLERSQRRPRHVANAHVDDLEPRSQGC
jgi:hypothetical protein